MDSVEVDECKILARNGEEQIRMGNTTEGITLLRMACNIGTSDPRFMSAIYSQLGSVYYAQKKYEKAKKYYSDHLLLAHKLNDHKQQANVCSNLCPTLLMLGEFQSALECAFFVRSCGEKFCDNSMECRGLYFIGLTYLNGAQESLKGVVDGWEKDATESLKQSIQYFKLVLQKEGDGADAVLCQMAVGNLANAHYHLGDYEKAIGLYLHRLEIANALNDKPSMRRTYTNMANVYIRMGNHSEAKRCCTNALGIVSEEASVERKKSTITLKMVEEEGEKVNEISSVIIDQQEPTEKVNPRKDESSYDMSSLSSAEQTTSSDPTVPSSGNKLSLGRRAMVFVFSFALAVMLGFCYALLLTTEKVFGGDYVNYPRKYSNSSNSANVSSLIKDVRNKE